MLDNLRTQATFQDDEPLESELEKPVKKVKIRRSLDQVTGTTAQQRFSLAVLFTIVVCLLGMMLLLLTQKIVPPFLH